MTDIPHSLEAEAALLCAVMIDPEVLSDVRAQVSSADFYREAHRLIWEALLALHDTGGALDVLSVGEHLKGRGVFDAVGGFDYLGALIDATPTSASAPYHAKIVRDRATRRRLIQACQETQRRALESDDTTEVLREAEAMLLTATDRGRSRGFRPVFEAVREALAVAERAQGSADGVVGIRTGLPTLDRMTAGLEPGGLTVLAARPSMGKSALGWQFAERAAMDEYGVCVASYEMADAQLGRRGLARLSNVDAHDIRRGRLDQRQWAALAEAGSRLGELPIWTNDQPPHEIEGLRSMVHRHLKRHMTRLVVVDYLQQMSGPKGGNRNNEVEHISRGLKRMAMELELHVVALAQLNRGVEHRTPPRPILSDLRDSGAVEQDADNVLLLWRPEYYFDDTTPDNARSEWQGRAELIVAKQRDGETGRIRMTWDGPRLRFTELERSPSEHAPQMALAT